MFDLPAVQSAIQSCGVDGWLLYDFRGSNVLANRVLQIPADKGLSRRFFFYIPATGNAQKLVHRIEAGSLDHLPGDKTVYLRWQELEEGIRQIAGSAETIAMEYSPGAANPYVSRIDAGTLEMVRAVTNANVVSSGDLIQIFEAVWTPQQWDLHLAAEKQTTAAFDLAWKFIADELRGSGTVEETAVQDQIMAHFAANNLTTYHPPIVAVGPNAGDPHYETGTGTNTTIRENNLVLIDLWAKIDEPDGVYSDLTRMGYTGSYVPEELATIFGHVTAARDAAIDTVRNAMSQNRDLCGWEVDAACRAVIDAAGYGDAFVHRTGHSIGRETHGNGANIDNLETKEDRRILPCTCFSIEPGIYLPEYGFRSEVNVYVDAEQGVHVTGGPVQTEILAVLTAG